MLGAAMNLVQNRLGGHGVTLQVDKNNEGARAIYRQMGFYDVGLGEKEGDLRMEWRSNLDAANSSRVSN